MNWEETYPNAPGRGLVMPVHTHTHALCFCAHDTTAVEGWIHSLLPPRMAFLHIHVPARTNRYLRHVCRDIALQTPQPHYELCDSAPCSSVLMKNFPELECYRDVAR